MSGTWRIGASTSAAQLAATIAFADTGVGNARVHLYSTARPSAPGAHTDTPMATVLLAKPCAQIVAGVLSLLQQDVGSNLVLTTGIPRWGEWVNGDGALVAEGSVTDDLNGGDFQIVGATTALGETSPTLYAGGLVVLGATTLV